MNHVFYNQALNTFLNYGARCFPTFADALLPEIPSVPLDVRSDIRVLPASRIASDFLVPEGLAREAWDELGPEERFYLKGLDLERAGETRSAAYQEMARGFGVQEYRGMLGNTAANNVRLKTAKEFGRRNLRRAGSQDQAEDRALEGFAGGVVRHVLYGIHAARETDRLKAPLDWFAANLPDYWSRQRRVIELLDYIGAVRTEARAAEAAVAQNLRGAVDNHRP